MKSQYLDSLLSNRPLKKSTQKITMSLSEFYDLGVQGRKRRLSLQTVMKDEKIWSKVKDSSDVETNFFIAGLLGNEMPKVATEKSLEEQIDGYVQTKAEVIEKKEEKPKEAELVQPRVMNLAELQTENTYLKRLVELYEKKLEQPIMVQVKVPKVKSSEDTFIRDDDRIIGKKTTFEYEE